MIQLLIIILLFCLLIYGLYIGVNRNYTIADYDLNSSGLIKTYSELKSNYNTTEFNNSYKNFTHLFWLKIRYPESGRILKHNPRSPDNNKKSLIIDFHKDNAVLDISLFDTNTSSPHLHIERTNFPMNTWIFVGLVMNGDTLDLYMQNKLIETRETASILINSNMTWGDVLYGKDSLDDNQTNFSKDNAILSAHRFFPYQMQQNEIDRIFKNEYPIYYNGGNRYEFNLELSKNGSSAKFTI
jgi:hypothetical protein